MSAIRTLTIIATSLLFYLGMTRVQSMSWSADRLSVDEVCLGSLVIVVSNQYEPPEIKNALTKTEILGVHFFENEIRWSLSTEMYSIRGNVKAVPSLTANALSSLQLALFDERKIVSAVANTRHGKPNFELLGLPVPAPRILLIGNQNIKTIDTWADCSRVLLNPTINLVLADISENEHDKARNTALFRDVFYMVNGYGLTMRKVIRKE